MSSYSTYGDLLRRARIRKRMDVPTMSRRLRIRPDILEAIENEEYEYLPPRNVTRNMIHAYAREVGVNPSEATRLYLDGLRRYESESSREPYSHSNFDMGDDTRFGQQARRAHERTVERNRRTRMQEQDDSYRRRSSKPAISIGSRDSGPQGIGNLTSMNSSYMQGGNRGGMNYLPIIIGGIVVIAIVVAVVFFVTGSKSTNTVKEMPSVPITGLTDTSDKSATNNTEQAQTPTAPTQATFIYNVPQGKEVYIEIYEGDGGVPSVAEVVSGPSNKKYSVTDTLKFVCTNPESVSLTVDGTKVVPEDPDGIGVYTYTVNFAEILEKWTAEHASASSAASNATKTTNNTSSSSSTNSTAR